MESMSVLCLALLSCLLGGVIATLEDHCTDVSFYDVVTYESTSKQCCDTRLEQVCYVKQEDSVCQDVVQLNCEVVAWAECKATSTSNPGTKCEVEYKDYDLKDCQEVETSTTHTKNVPDCKTVTKNNCVTDWDIDADGNKVWAGTETCTPVTWEECEIVEKEVEFPSIETECDTVANIKWTDFVDKDVDIEGMETSCEVKSAVNCEETVVEKCASATWQECRMEPVDECESVFVHKPYQEKVHQKKCLID